MSESSAGRQLKATADSAAWQQLEEQLRLSGHFGTVDQLTSRLLMATLRGTEAVMNRPGSGGGAEATGRWSSASTEEVSRRVA